MGHTLICDLDGTLMDTREDLAVACNHARVTLGMSPLPLAEIIACVGDGAATLIERITPDCSPTDRRVALNAFRAFYVEHCTIATLPYPGIIDMMDALRHNGWILTVATNKPLAPTLRILEHFNLMPRIAGVRGGDGPKKPDPTQLLELFAETGGAPGTGWMIGDHVTDLCAAQAAGCRSLFCRWGFGDSRGQTFDAVAHHPAEVVAIVGRAHAAEQW